ncbi:MAG: hypothetical protein WCK48_02880 [bacterium]
MIKQRNTFLLGIFILLIWVFFGIPTSWKIFFTILSGLYLIFISVKISFPKKGIVKRARKKEKTTPVFTENSPIETETKSIDDSQHRGDSNGFGSVQ